MGEQINGHTDKQTEKMNKYTGYTDSKRNRQMDKQMVRQDIQMHSKS